MIILSSISAGLKFWSLNHTLIYENFESKILKNIKYYIKDYQSLLQDFWWYTYNNLEHLEYYDPSGNSNFLFYVGADILKLLFLFDFLYFYVMVYDDQIICCF